MTEMRLETKAPAGLPENKAATFGTEAVLDEFGRAFEAFKEANDARLCEIETRLTADVVTEEKLARIDAALDQAKNRLDRISLDRARPPLGGAEPPRDASATEHKAAFDLYVRAGESAGLKRLEE
jgi:HK97 family phage major capsid protein